jgi:hypothetical protein
MLTEQKSGFKKFGEEQLQTRQPFPIRGHHLNLFLLARMNPHRNEGRSNGNGYKDLARSAASKIVANVISYGDQYYINDAIGNSDARREATLDVYTEILSSFDTLPDDFPIRVSFNKDLICGACPVGRHCDLQRPSVDDDYTFRIIQLIRSYSAFSTQVIEPPKEPDEGEGNLVLEVTAGVLRGTLDFMNERKLRF